MASISLRTRLITSRELALGRGQMPMNTAVWPEKSHLRVIILGTQHHVADILQPHDGAVLLANHQSLEFLHRAQVGVGGQIDLDQRTLGLAHGGQKVVGRQGLAHLDRADVEGGHAIGFEPDAHGKGAGAEDIGALNAFDGRKPRLDDCGPDSR